MKISSSAIATLVIVGTALGGSAIAVNARSGQTDVNSSSISQVTIDPAQKQISPVNPAAPIGTIENVTPTIAPTNPVATPTPTLTPSLPPVVSPVTPPNYGGSGNGDDSENGDYNGDDSGYGNGHHGDDGDDNEGDYED